MQSQVLASTVKITHISGAVELIVTDVNGSERLLQVGDIVYAGESLLLPAGVAIETDANVETPNFPSNEDDEISAIQQLLEQGGDLDELPATAAGNTEAEGSDSFVSVSRTGAETIAQAGFETSGPAAVAAPAFAQDASAVANLNPIATDNSAAINEDADPLSGNLLTDDDNNGIDQDPEGSSLTVIGVNGDSSGIIEGQYGTLQWFADGSYRYTPNDHAQTLAAGELAQEQFQYHITDGDGGNASATLTITITGSDDLPVISADTGEVTEGSDVAATGQLTATDIDNPDLAFVASNISTEFGTFSVDANGNWTFSLDNSNPAVQALAAGEQLPLPSFEVILSDGSSTTVDVVVIGTDDLPEISTDTGMVTEDSEVMAEGTLTATDVDGDAPTFIANTITTEFGTFSVDANGNWTFSLDNSNPAVQALAAGEQLPLPSFEVVLSDGSTTTVDVVIIGTDDLPIISADSGEVVEDSDVAATGQLTATDVDNPDLAFVANSITTEFGTFTIDADGNWTFSLDNSNPAVQALAAGEQLPLPSFEVELSDGSTTTVDVVVIGTDDAPVISSDTGTVTEDSDVAAEGTLTATDVDSDAPTFTANTITTEFGTFSVDANGNWTFSLDNSNPVVQALAEGEQLSLPSFEVILSDGSTTTVTITITGTDDLPEISSDADR
ncbi:VCBS domain-containing protein, partial [uncultured Ferrimonas sp.]|uniref:VCBS domain-containing protein n=1 Tax=uncultured Ferrimonas sp. TaxID=432640 RepID=UPI00260894FF